MNIYINSKLHELPNPQPISKALELLNIAHAKGIAIAVNNLVIPRTQWEQHLLQDNDDITLIKATQGG
jgi:sulfur carrier protein